MKRIQLVERNEKGQIHKNESYFYPQMKHLVMDDDPEYWQDWWWGRIRRNALQKIFDRFAELTDKDRPGKHTIKKQVQISERK